MANSNFLDLGAKGTLVNVYGPSAYHQKLTFMNFLNWLKFLFRDGSWIMRGYFDLITSLRGKKGGIQVLDRFQEEFRDILVHSSLIDLKMGDG